MNDVMNDFDILQELEESHELPCEHSQHEIMPLCHSGMGAWYKVHDKCPNCGYQCGVLLVCQPFYEICQWEMIVVRCANCQYVDRPVEFEFKWVKK